MGSFARRVLVGLTVGIGVCVFWAASASAATFVVRNAHDDGSQYSLRWAIQQANLTTAADTIKFAIPLNSYAGIGDRTISIKSDLDAITHPVTIDGTSQPDYSGTPLIRIDNGCSCQIGFKVQSPQVKIIGLSITHFAVGIWLAGGHDTVAGDWIGLDQAGGSAGNESGILVQSDANLIGGNTAAARNIISYNAIYGIVIAAGKGNVASGNFIGVDPTGEASNANGSVGIFIENTSTTATVVGGMSSAARNVISANGDGGIQLYETNGNFIQGNFIGTDATGTFALANGQDGINLTTANGNMLSRNVVSGQPSNGISLTSGSSGNVVSANLIGTNAAGTAAIPNGSGIGLTAPNNMIGGSSPAAGNVISGNGSGISLYAGDAHGNTIAANLIGVTKSGTPLGNQCDGVDVDATTAANTIGGTTPGARNVISANGAGIGCGGAGVQNGIELDNAQATVVEGNYIGTNLAGSSGLGNYADGVRIAAGSTNNLIGGTTPGARNVISGNGFGNHGNGVTLTDSGTSRNVVEGNYVGLNATGTAALANAHTGVFLNNSSSNTIGGTTAGGRNVISGNNYGGVDDYGGSANTIEGNYIGTNPSGSSAIPNHCDGFFAFDATLDTIGGRVTGARNVISGNGVPGGCGGSSFGIELFGSSDFSIFGNYIGTNASGSAALGDHSSGIVLEGGTSDTVIGASDPSARNVISGSFDDGIDITDTSYRNSILGNFIGTNAAGTGKLGNANFGIYVDASGAGNVVGAPDAGNVIAFNGLPLALDGVRIDGLNAHVSIRTNNIFSNGGLGIMLADDANGVQAAPQITKVKTTATSTTIDYTLASNANTSYDVDFFANAACDPSGGGEGQKYLGSKTTVTDGIGNATDEVVFPAPLGALKIVSATATDESTNDTSPFSDCAH